MGIDLSEAQSKAIELAVDQPPSVLDPRTGKIYALVSANVFDCFKAMDGGADYSLSDTCRGQIESALKAGWDDPAMDEYNEYDAHR